MAGKHDPMTDDSALLAIATAFDAGPPPIICGKLWNPAWDDAYNHNVTVKRIRQEDGSYLWGIFEDENYCLSTSGSWVYWRDARKPSVRKRTRFATAREALDFYWRWRSAVLAWAERQIERHGPDHIFRTMPKYSKKKLEAIK